MKAYHVKVYLTPKGIKTKKIEVSVKKESDGFYYYKEKSHQFSWAFHDWGKIDVKVGTTQITPNCFDKKIFDKVTIAESWCFKKDYKKTRLYLIKQYESYISLIKKNILEKEKEIRNDIRKLIGYKKGLNIFLKSIKQKNERRRKNFN
jgi:hypothetical protein